MQFNGFTRETSDFLWDLAFHNERPWFQEHKEQFLRVLKEPFDAMGRETLALMEARFPEEPWQLHISRIYRDARRLFGRGPYKDHLWLTIWSGADRHDSPAFWFEVAASGYNYGTGFYAATAAEMENYRKYIDTHPEQMKKLARALNRQDVFQLTGPDYKRPKGDVGELLNPWYNKRWLSIEADFDFEGDIFSSELPKIVADAFTFLMPYYRLFRSFRQEKEENFSDR